MLPEEKGALQSRATVRSMHSINVPCVYDNRRLKPGLRAGAVDQLYRRIETPENMFLGQEMLWQQVRQALGVDIGFF